MDIMSLQDFAVNEMEDDGLDASKSIISLIGGIIMQESEQELMGKDDHHLVSESLEDPFAVMLITICSWADEHDINLDQAVEQKVSEIEQSIHLLEIMEDSDVDALAEHIDGDDREVGAFQ